MNTKKTLVALIVIAIIAIGAYSFFPKKEVVKDQTQNFGAFPGTDITEPVYFRGGISDGSGCYATSTTGTITPGILEKNNCIRIAATGAGQGVISLTLPATTTVSNLLQATGACKSWWIDATAVATATTTTIVAGTGVNLVGLDATGAGTGADVIDGNEYGKLTLCREADSDVTGFVEEWIHAD